MTTSFKIERGKSESFDAFQARLDTNYILSLTSIIFDASKKLEEASPLEASEIIEKFNRSLEDYKTSVSEKYQVSE